MRLTQKQKEILGVSVAVIVVVAIVLLVYFAAIAPHNAGPGPANIPGTGTPGASTATALIPQKSGSAPAPAGGFLTEGFGGDDKFAAHQLHRDHMASSSRRRHSERLRANPSQISARRARMTSVRGVDRFGGPQGGYGWAPGPADEESPHGGWQDGQAAAFRSCERQCAENCNGSACEAHCSDGCRDPALVQASA